jgi:glycosyltransferase involved in cell wall biosynthesis
MDALRIRRLRLPAKTLLYSPGYNGGVSRTIQLLTVHDLIHLTSPGPRAGVHRLYYEHIVKRLIQQTGFAVTVSNTSRDELLAWIDSPDVEVLVSGNGCSEVFRVREPGGGIGANGDYFLYVGNFRHHKNPERAFPAVSRVSGARLIVVSHDEEAANRLAAFHGLSDRVTIRPGVSDEELAGLYRGAKGLLFPSLLEGFGLPVLEALTAGCPVVHLESCQSVREIGMSFPGAAFPISDSTDEWADAVAMLNGCTPIVPPMPRRYEWDAVAKRLDQHVMRVAAENGVV